MGADLGVDFLVGLEGFMCGFDGGVGVFGRAVWSCGPNFAVAWVVDVEAFAGFGFDPFAADEGFGAEEVGVVDLLGVSGSALGDS